MFPLGKNFFYKLMLHNSTLLVLLYRLALWRIEWPYKLLTEVLEIGRASCRERV